ncbi:MAG: dihydrofolate reductase [Hydrogenophaga sp.]|uniref:dihydrofolate reductase n=1 Tax=Hydrogenophaga sp. TaxID=1904254 RepID=UPI003D11E889
MKQPRLHLIFARASNGVIGRDNQLPWHLPEDLAHFKRTTLGRPVIMGRKTWDSLPARFRPLPGRLNIVVTRDGRWQVDGAARAGSLQEALALCPTDATDAWVIGGAQIYAAALPLAQSAVVTEIAQDFEGDAHAPVFGPEWREIAREHHTSTTGLPFAFVTYHRST